MYGYYVDSGFFVGFGGGFLDCGVALAGIVDYSVEKLQWSGKGEVIQGLIELKLLT